MRQLLSHHSPKHSVLYGAVCFAVCMGSAYLFYPHLSTFSVFGAMHRTLTSYLLAMATSFGLLWYVGGKLRQHPRLRWAGVMLRAGAVSIVLVVCIPYAGSGTQKDVHDSAALVFALLTTAGVLWVAQVLRSVVLGALGVAQLIICALNLIFLARYAEHPVYPWTWMALEVVITISLMVSLYLVTSLLEKQPKASSD